MYGQVVTTQRLTPQLAHLARRPSGHLGPRAGRVGDVGTLLVDAVRALPRPAGIVNAFVHGEAVAVRAVRKHLLVEGIVERDHLSASPYWRRGHTDEEWRTVKSAWQREVELDAELRSALHSA